ncbi:MAG: phosphohistidine phosphatase SixA [Opitutales bacterium]
MSLPLFIARHGEAGMAATDEERPLTEHGQSHVRLVAERFRERYEIGSLKIVASPLLRAQQTAQIWNDVLGKKLKIQTEDLVVPEGNVVQFARKLESQDAAWLVVSHFPFVPGLASYLTSGQRDRVRFAVPTGTVIALAPEGKTGRPGSYRIYGIDN